MGKKRKPNKNDYDSDSYDDFEYYDEFDDDMISGEMRKLSKDFYSTDWEDPSGGDRKFSTRRKIERRNDLKELFQQFDDYDDFELETDWY